MASQLLIDGHSLLFRAYHALPPLTTQDGIPTGAVHGFFSMLFKVAESERPDRLVVVFDAPAKTFRHEQYAAYKGTRQETPEDFRPQVGVVQEILAALGIPMLSVPGYEADDVLGTLAQIGRQRQYKTRIITGDRDLLQLVDDQVEVLLTARTGTDVDRMDPVAVRQKMGVDPVRVPDLKGLMGDSSDNIPGVVGIGPKSAQALLEEFGSLDRLLENVSQVTNTRWRNLLTGHEDEARTSRDLATIVIDAPITWPEVSEPFRVQVTPELIQLLDRYQLAALRRRLAPTENSAVTPTVPLKKTAALTQGALGDLTADGSYVLLMESIDRIWILDTKTRVYGSLECKDLSSHLKLVTWGGKDVLRQAWLLGQTPPLIIDDGKIQAYLLNAESGKYDLDDIAIARGYEVSDIQTRLSAIEALVESQRQEILEKGLDTLYRTVELPLMQVLARMEATGILVDREQLKALGKELEAAIQTLSQEIYELAGREFNINSPSQLGDILFNKLNLPTLKKTKTGFSTDAETLEQLAPLHPLVDKVLLYRQHMKIQGTYVDGLLPLVKPDARVHTTFHQTVAATGRLSSSDPNLQNIPVRLPLGRRVRGVFIPSPGRDLLAADYSQVELRLLAHLSQDENLLAAFAAGEDIHRRTAAEIFGIPIEDVDSVWRNRAKAVNFGIVYGISDFGLSRDTGVSRAEAKDYITKYFARYPKLRSYFDEVVGDARKHGEVVTILGRIRPLPDINASNRVRRQYAERMAVNTVIQGSAADLIKVAMVQIDRAMAQAHLESTLLLQVHDELIWDAVPDETARLCQLATEHMVGALDLKVPLVVEFKSGSNWENMTRIVEPGGTHGA